MRRLVIGAAALGLLLAGCSNGDGGEAAPATAPAPTSKAGQIAYIAATHPAFTASFADHVCSDLGKYATEGVVQTQGEYLHYKSATGSSPEDAQWMVDQAVHIECPSYSSYAVNRPAWLSEEEAGKPARSSGSVELRILCSDSGVARVQFGVSDDSIPIVGGEEVRRTYGTTPELGDELLSVTVTPTSSYCSTVLTDGIGKILTRRHSMDAVEVAAIVTAGA